MYILTDLLAWAVCFPLHGTWYSLRIHHFTVVCSVTWPLNASGAGGDLVLIQTSLLFCAHKVNLMLARCIYMSTPERSASKQGHLQPHCLSKARWPSRQLYLMVYCSFIHLIIFIHFHATFWQFETKNSQGCHSNFDCLASSRKDQSEKTTTVHRST